MSSWKISTRIHARGSRHARRVPPAQPTQGPTHTRPNPHKAQPTQGPYAPTAIRRIVVRREMTVASAWGASGNQIRGERGQRRTYGPTASPTPPEGPTPA